MYINGMSVIHSVNVTRARGEAAEICRERKRKRRRRDDREEEGRWRVGGAWMQKDG